ncbi:MAG: hypothetical protein R3C71_14535 [Candidatus Krumholzibacteriia bacterium]|nr:hypothetical protein [Candidatus Latescibacterota bacterium]MCB9516149.1 hypothetical protein [Candidatus Latescibacterota bacterium]
MLRRLHTVAVALTLALPLQAHALQPLDDFDSGPFDYTAADGFTAHDVYIPNSPSHAIDDTRRVYLDPVGGTVSARTVYAGSSYDRALDVGVAGDGYCTLQYHWGYPLDLTLGGQVDRIELEMLGSAPGATVHLHITDADHLGSWELTTTGGEETLIWDYADVAGSGVDLDAVTGIALEFSPAPQHYLVGACRFHASGWHPVDLVEEFVATQVPPYPGPPLGWQVWEQFGQPLYLTELIIDGAVSDSGHLPTLAGEWEQWPAGGGWAGAIALYWDPAVPWTNTDFSLRFRYSAVDALVPEAYPPDPILTAEGAVLDYPLRLGVEGQAAGVSMQRLQFDIPGGQGLQLEDMTVVHGRSWTPEFTVNFRLGQGGDIDFSAPFLVIGALADWEPGTLTAVPDPDDRAPRSLRAMPAVTRAGTEILPARPFAAGARLTVHDVTGRRVATLPTRPGAASASWDGRDAEGRPTASGVYFLRLTDARGTASARVLRLR